MASRQEPKCWHWGVVEGRHIYMLLLSRSQQQDADNILQTSSPKLAWKKKKNNNKMMAPRHIMTSQPFTNSPSGNLAFQSRLADTALFSGYKKRQLESKENRTEAAKQAGWWGDGSGSTELVRSLLLLFLMYFKLSSTRKEGFLIAEFTHSLTTEFKEVQRHIMLSVTPI